jgi:hypothetical protein
MRRKLQNSNFLEITVTDRAQHLAADDRIEEMQLERLASAVLSKSPADLSALAEANPMIVWEWIDAFRRQKIQAESDARFWSAAMASLATARPDAVRGAAE